MELDDWQEEVLNTKGNIVLRSGRQVGKSTIIGLKAAKYALENPNKLIMVISKVERQAGLLFSKIMYNLLQIDKTQIKTGRNKKTKELMSPTKTKINLKNGSIIYCLPAGDTGYGIMGYTIDLLIADEAAFIPEEVWNSIVPALAVSRGNIWLLSTPFLKEGYYYNCFEDPSFTSFHQSSEECPRRDDVFLAHKKETLTKAQYAQMYLGLFVDELRRFFTDDLINNSIVPLDKSEIILTQKGDKYLGVDVARMGEDETVLCSVTRQKQNLKLYDMEITKKTMLTKTVRLIKFKDANENYKKIYIDSTGMGWGVFDPLKEDPQTKRKVVAIENAKKSLNREKGKNKDQTKISMKEDLYMNLKILMEQKKIILPDFPGLKQSLKAVQAENHPITKKLIISGEYTHIVEALIRAAWCVKDKSLNIYYY